MNQTKEEILRKARARIKRLYTSPEGKKKKAEIDKRYHAKKKEKKNDL